MRLEKIIRKKNLRTMVRLIAAWIMFVCAAMMQFALTLLVAILLSNADSHVAASIAAVIWLIFATVTVKAGLFVGYARRHRKEYLLYRPAR